MHMPSVLVIDDDPMIRKLVGRMLKIKGYESIELSGGEEAIEKIPELPDEMFVILDLSMPGISGEETLVVLHREKPQWKIILSTGFGGSLDTQYFSNLGVYKFLNKPFEMNELFEALT